ncbi:MAG TPA: hypothetical protein VIR33_17070 [Thermopolyspora sp.]
MSVMAHQQEHTPRRRAILGASDAADARMGVTEVAKNVALHLGLIRGALAEVHAPVAITRIDPFAEPGACLTHLGPVQERHSSS